MGRTEYLQKLHAFCKLSKRFGELLQIVVGNVQIPEVGKIQSKGQRELLEGTSLQTQIYKKLTGVEEKERQPRKWRGRRIAAIPKVLLIQFVVVNSFSLSGFAIQLLQILFPQNFESPIIIFGRDIAGCQVLFLIKFRNLTCYL